MPASTVAEALKALEWAGVLTWQNRDHPHPRALPRPVRPRRLALAGDQDQQLLPVHDPQAALVGVPASKSDQRTGTPNQELSKPLQAPAVDPDSPLERALARFAAAVAAKKASNKAPAG